MNPEQLALDARVTTFAADWLRLGDPQLGTQLVADPILVLGTEGAAAVPRSAFLAAIAARSQTVTDLDASATILTGMSAQALGEKMVLATINWVFSHGELTASLTSDFLLEREASGALRCVAYLPRTNVLDHLG